MSFIAGLSFEDLQRLRAVVKKVHMKYNPIGYQDDKEADKIIESLGPETQQKMLKMIIDNKLL